MFSFLAVHSGFFRRAILLFLAAFLAGGCTGGGTDANTEPGYLIRVGDVDITVGEFNRAFEMAMTAYPYDIVKQRQALREAREQVLQELVERAVLAARAKDLGIDVTSAELADAISRIKEGYPEGAFEQALLESAVSYEAWKAALRRRLLMEKVVARELESRIAVTDDEIREYYRSHYAQKGDVPAAEALHPDIRKAVVRQLRAEKIEAAYGDWLENLKETYAIDINSVQWGRIAEESVRIGGAHADTENDNGKRPNG